MSHYLDTSSLDLETLTSVRAHSAFSGIQNEAINTILPYFTMVTLEADRFLIKEGHETSIDLYLVISGRLEVIKEGDSHESETKGTGNQFTVATLNAGDIIGELSFIKGGPRSASIKTVTKSVLLGLNPNDLSKLEAEYPRAWNTMLKNILAYIGQRLKQTTDDEVDALKVELQNSMLNSRANLFFSYIIGLLCVYNLAIQTITNLSVDANRASIISAVIIIVFSAVLILMIQQSKLPIRIFGLTTDKWKLAVRESLLWSVAIIAAMILVKWLLIQNVPRYHELKLIDFDPTQQKYLTFNFFLYGMHSPIQEFIARGVLQGSLQHFFHGKNVTFRAVIISNALFSATHVHLLGGLLGLIVFVPGLFWGWLYSRHENLIGVSISHILIGWTALFFLNLESLF